MSKEFSNTFILVPYLFFFSELEERENLFQFSVENNISIFSSGKKIIL